MNTNFNILNKMKKTNLYIENLIINFPKKEFVLKNNLEKSMFKTIELIFTYSVQSTYRVKEKYLKDLIIELSMLNYYIELSYERKFISKHQRDVVGRYLIEIRKMVFGVIQNEKDKV